MGGWGEDCRVTLNGTGDPYGVTAAASYSFILCVMSHQNTETPMPKRIVTLSIIIHDCPFEKAQLLITTAIEMMGI